jgi:glycerophosphoryl diester phosphodiesterase
VNGSGERVGGGRAGPAGPAWPSHAPHAGPPHASHAGPHAPHAGPSRPSDAAWPHPPRAGLPLVFAHRGSSTGLPEHTLEAYLRAIEQGADGVECDVRLTRDGHLVCHHDRRLGRTSNGRGAVSRRRLDELDRLDFGSWAGAAPAPLLTLDTLLSAVRGTGRPLHLLIEVKIPDRYGQRVEHRLVALLRRHGLVPPAPDDPLRVSVMSFSPVTVRRIRRLAPSLPTVLLLALLPPGVRFGRLPAGAEVAGPSLRLVRSRPGLVPALQAAGNRVYVWTVNEPADVDLVVSRGVDGIITDQPAETLARLGR